MGTLLTSQGDRIALARSVVTFLGKVGKGCSPSAFGNRFEHEVREGCVKTCRGKPALIQQLARFLVDEPDHHGVSRMLRDLAQLRTTENAFSGIEIDHSREFSEAVRLGDFDEVDEGFAEITHRRTYSRPRPPKRAISTIHKAKGLECEGTILLPCDAGTFPDKADSRRLFYVAISRAKSRLMLVVSREAPSPLLSF